MRKLKNIIRLILSLPIYILVWILAGLMIVIAIITQNLIRIAPISNGVLHKFGIGIEK